MNRADYSLLEDVSADFVVEGDLASELRAARVAADAAERAVDVAVRRADLLFAAALTNLADAKAADGVDRRAYAADAYERLRVANVVFRMLGAGFEDGVRDCDARMVELAELLRSAK